ncbi:MAG: hypothetical protein AB1898_18120 [Acidobacteriota bacterium]
MKKLMLPVFAALVAMALVIPALAAEGGQKGGEAQNISGKIAQVDLATNTVTIQMSDGQLASVQIDSSTQVTVGGKKASAADLKDGQSVNVRVKGGKAVSIDA